MSDVTIRALVRVCEDSATELGNLTDRLSTVSPRQAEAVLRAIQKTGDVLSSGLDRLSFFAENLPDEETTDGALAPTANRELLLAAMKMGDATTRGLCPECGGIRRAS